MFQGKPEFEKEKTTSSLQGLFPSVRIRVHLPKTTLKRFSDWMESQLAELCADYPEFQTPDSNTFFLFFERE